VSRREVIRRRRANVLFLLVATTGLALFLAATTSSSFWVYVFAASFVALCGYVYKLAQLRQYELDSRHPDIRHADVRW
jgi:4-hydroxybenzoate polyprenyltransferase